MGLSEIANTAMAIVYLACGTFLLVGKNIFNFSDFQKIGLGCLLVLYGLFRIYSLLKKRKQQNDKNED
ncbi:MAG TPA: hypothetical protein DHV28_16560 [Ignavibacteriales bacterium]|nr:hypothetical protein [Ignavibacteriales bacterium]